MRRRFFLLWASVLALAAAWPYRHVPGLGYCGIDTPVLIEIHRAKTWDDVGACLTREFRDGIEPGVAFYRPWTSLSYLADAAWAGSRPVAYHVTDVALFSACAVVLFGFLVAAGAPAWMAAGAGLWFAWYPLAVEVVPVPARRADLWVVLWLTVASWAWLGDRVGSRRLRAVWIVAAVLATLSKESGFLVPLLLLALAGTARPSWRELAVVLAVIVPGGLLRWMVLGGGGGYGAFSPSGMLEGLRVLAQVSGGPLGGWILVPVAGLGLPLWRARSRPPVRTLARWGLVWLAATLFLLCFAGGVGARYLLALLPGLAALGVAACLAGRTGRGLVALIFLLTLSGSPAWTDYPEWKEVSRHLQAWTRQRPPEEDAIVVVGLPHDLALRPPPRHRVRSAGIWRDFGLESAWRLQHGRAPRVLDVAPVWITGLDASYAVEARRRGRTWSFTLRGDGARFVAPPGDRLEIHDLDGPVHVWNGEGLQRVD